MEQAGSLQITIVQDGLNFTVTTHSLLGDKTYSYTADGTEYSPPSLDGSPWTAKTVVGDGCLLDTIQTGPGVLTAKRYRDGGEYPYLQETTLTTTSGEVIVMKRYFNAA
jgi:hypothetical protein